MTFEAGPWFAFGTEMLERLVAKSEADSRAMGDVDQSRNSLVSDTGKVNPSFPVPLIGLFIVYCFQDEAA